MKHCLLTSLRLKSKLEEFADMELLSSGRAWLEHSLVGWQLG